ncbi:MAG: hypothetical protein HQ518_08155 [Rhodopirellula sp.]|nr:hypothetical protein [Rhodopirellula sp.]
MFPLFVRRRKPATSEYLRRCKLAIRSGKRLPAPETVNELFEVLTTFPRESVGFRPTLEALRLMDLPSGWPTCEEGIE